MTARPRTDRRAADYLVARRNQAMSPPITTTYHPRPKDAGAAAQQEKSLRMAREVGLTEARADKMHGFDREAEAKAYRASLVNMQRNAYERGVRELIDHLRTGLFNSRSVADAERFLATIPPWCPSCGEPMEREPASPADPDVGIMRPTPAHWVCCGVAIQDSDGPIATEDDHPPELDENVRPDPFEPR